MNRAVKYQGAFSRIGKFAGMCLLNLRSGSPSFPLFSKEKIHLIAGSRFLYFLIPSPPLTLPYFFWLSLPLSRNNSIGNACLLSRLRVLKQVWWWSVTMVTRYDVISSRWSGHFWVRIHVFSYKALQTIQVNMFLFDGLSTNNIIFSCKENVSHAGRELQQVKAFPVGSVEGHCFCSSRTG